MRLLPPRRIGWLILLLSLSHWLTGCTTINTGRNQWQQFQKLGWQAYLLTCLLGLLVLGLIAFLVYAQKRWEIVQLIGPLRWLAKIPGIGPYIGQARLLEQTSKTLQKQAKQGQKLMAAGQKAAGTAAPDSPPPAEEPKTSWWQQWFGREKPNPVPDSPPPPPTPLPPDITPVVPATAAPSPEQPRIGRLSVPVTDVYSFSELPSTLPNDLLGKRIGRYQIDAVLETSTHSTIYQGFDQKLSRPVRLHVLRTSLFESEEEKPQFIQDLRQRVGLTQQGLTQVYDYDIQPDYIFVITEWVQGPDILGYVQHLWSQGRQVSYHKLLSLLAQTASALHTAHTQKLYHLQLTPQHIRLTILGGAEADPEQQSIQPRLEDVGLGLLISRAEEALPSAWPYVAPELAWEMSTDSRTDVYALGAILYQLMTGRPPYTPSTLSHVGHQHQRPPTPPSQLRPALPTLIEDIILKAMARNAADRYQTAHELAQALTTAAERLRGFGDRNIQPSELEASLPWVRVATLGEAPRLIPLTKEQMFIGNSPDVEIWLPSQAVSQQHAYLRRGNMGWQIVDLDSPNGIFLDGVRLLSQVPETWESTREVRVGPYTLTRYDGRDMTADDLTWNPADVGRVMEPAPQASPNTLTTASLTLEPAHATLPAGEQTILQIALTNQSVRVDHFRISLSGLPAEWLTLSDNDIQLMPGTTGYLLLTIAPTAGQLLASGDYPFTLFASPLSDLSTQFATEGRLTIPPFARLTADLHPERIRTKGTATLTLRNEGNLATTITLAGRDPADEVRFGPLGEPFTLAVGGQEQIAVRVEPRQRPFTGTNLLHPFDVTITTPGNPPVVKSGLLEVRPYLPTWLIGLLGMLGLLLCIMAAFAFNYVDEQNQRATVAAMLIQTPPAPPTAQPTFTPTPVPLPLTCVDIRDQNAGRIVDGEEAAEAAVDGEYTIYLNRDPARPLTIYCHNMATAPTEYLSLPNSGAGVNFASVRYPTQQLTTSYTKVRLNPRTLVLDVADRTFATEEGELPAQALIRSVDYGTAVGCNEGVPGTVIANANIDLTGLPLVLADEVSFFISGPDVEGTGATIDESRQVVQMAIGGRCGWVQPLGTLRLVYALPVEPE